MDIVASVVTDQLSKLVNAAIQETSYSFRFNKYVNELQTEKQNLQSKIRGVLERSKEAKKKTEKVVSDVEEWLSKADSLMAQVVQLEERTTSRKKTSCLKCYPNLIRRYSLAKQLEEKTNEIVKHGEIEFPEFSRAATLVGMNYFSSEGFIPFNSRQEAYDLLLEALKDDEVHMIGLYGMGGCGKTTMVKEVGKEAEQFFDKVIFVVVSSPIDIRKIQTKIASQLELDLKEEEELERAKRLSMRLSCGDRFLIILDDIWEKLDLEDIGIPIVENQRGCTTLITTRKSRVCGLMNCKRIIPLKVLNEDEAWSLFEKHAGVFDDNSDTLIRGLAQEITKECGGLPIAIAAVSSSLKGKPQIEWDEALKTLRDSNLVDIEQGLKNPYTCLRLSYDNLENEVAKSLLLLCSVFPEDYEIPIDDLTMIGVGLGLVEGKEVHSYQRARNQVISKGKNKLIDSCLLLDVDDKDGHVKMHDLVRDVALWIAMEKNKFIMGHLKEDVIMKDNTIRYLWFDKVDNFPHKLDCPELEFLHVSIRSEHDVDITNDFFEGMEKLKVLILECAFRKHLQLPSSFHSVNNLRCLFFHDWVLGDISFIGSLERLESLKLWGCSFDELPNNLTQQKNLRSLDIWCCQIQRNPYEVIGRCSQLEVLCFCENDVKDWGDQGKDGAKFFDKTNVAPKLDSYCLDLGDDDDDGFFRPRFPVARSLYVRDLENCMSNATIKCLIEKAEVLYLRGIHRSCKNIIPHIFQTIGGSMDALTKLSLSYSDTIECVTDMTFHLDQIGIIPKLTNLYIRGMKNLKTVCHGLPPPGHFANLEVLFIYECDSIEHIITDEVKEIVPHENDEYQRNYGSAFPKLKRLRIRNCNQLESLMPVSFVGSLAPLEDLHMGKANRLKSLFGQPAYEDSHSSKFHIIELSSLNCLNLTEFPNMVSICPKNYHPTWPSLVSLTVQNVYN